MNKLGFIAFFLLLLASNSYGQFNSSYSTWPVPDGGQIKFGENQGYLSTSDFDLAYENEGSQLWSLTDLNGDDLPDLVVTCQNTANGGVIFNNGSPYWKVYFNTGTEFSSTASIWSVPDGGQIKFGTNQGYITTSDFDLSYEDNGSELWNCTDINGDNLPDLVVTCHNVDNGGVVFNNGGPYWKVFYNTGTGFSTTSTNWSVPEGGQIKFGNIQGFISTSDYSLSYEDNGSQLWDFTDINGDNLPDLVVTCQNTANGGVVFDNGGTYWKVYNNTGAGFSSTASNWSVPSGGQIKFDTNQGFISTSDFDLSYENEGSQLWDFTDINGDNLPDLVVTCQNTTNGGIVFNNGGPYWKIYNNTGTGFSSSAISWSVPEGGQIKNGTNQGYFSTGDFDLSYEDTGSNLWNFTDVNGDELPDLVVTCRNTANGGLVFNNGSPYWKVYSNTGAGFASAATNWSIPDGGQIKFGTNQGFISTVDFNLSYEDIGSQLWNTTDLNGDNLPDLVVTCQNATNGGVVFNNGSPHWRVYLNNAPTAIEDLNTSELSLNPYPNPTKNVFSVDLSGLKSPRIKIYNGLGVLIHQELGVSNNIFTWDLVNHSSGVYYLIVESDGKVFNSKVIRE